MSNEHKALATSAVLTDSDVLLDGKALGYWLDEDGPVVSIDASQNLNLVTVTFLIDGPVHVEARPRNRR